MWSYKCPNGVDKNKANAALRQDWDRYVKNLLTHECGHRDLGVRAAREIESAVLDQPAQGTCNGLGNSANQMGQAILESILAEEKQ